MAARRRERRLVYTHLLHLAWGFRKGALGMSVALCILTLTESGFCYPNASYKFLG